ncbi:uncharacterized protein BJ171DRAFT_532510, partial [Polychytrium aggregatum]|uniref:uncharacterized protein n=1 Tax=Polychytrium aggregatum TaxID=110093 RepID=UPI0022FE1848
MVFFGKPKFSFDEIPPLNGKTVIITGANSGLGRVSALEIARKGAHVILACRSKERALPVVDEIKAVTSNQNVEFAELDLASLASVQKFSSEFLGRHLELDILINNAGIMAKTEFQLSVDGIEMQLASNHFGHFLLTLNLLPAFPKDRPARIVNLSSLAHQLTRKNGIDFDDYNNPQLYSPWQNYGQSKLANILFTKELQKRLEAAGIHNIYVNAVHPGAVDTNLAHGAQYMPPIIVSAFKTLLAVKPEFGALTQVYVATSPEIEKENYRGQYFIPTAILATPSNYATDGELATKLWDFTVGLLSEKGFKNQWIVD